MHHLSSHRLLLALACTLAIPAGTAWAADVPFAGTWRLTVYQGPQSISLALVKIEEKDGKPAASLVAAGLANYKAATINNVQVDDKGVRFTLTNQGRAFIIHGVAPKGNTQSKRLFSTVTIGNAVLQALLDQTSDTTIDEKTAIKPDAGLAALAKAVRTTGAAKEKALQDVLKTYAGEPAAYSAAQQLLTLKAGNTDTSEADLKAAAETLVAVGQLYGSEQELQTNVAVAAALSQSGKGAGLALAFIQKAEAMLPTGPSAATAALRLLNLRAGLKGAAAADLKIAAERYLKLAEQGDATAELAANLAVAQALLKAEQGAALGAGFLKQAEEQVEKAQGPQARSLALQVLEMRVGIKGTNGTELKAAAERYLKAVQPANTAAEIQAHLAAARLLLKSDNGTPIGLELAKKAEGLLDKDTSLASAPAVLQVLASALRKTGKADDAKTLESKAAKMEEQLDEEFLKKNMAFTPEKFGGRKGKSQRVVVCELFTGAQCPPCVSADIAFDAALKTYKDTEVVFLQYHLHIPGPDALTNAHTEAVAGQYAINGTPSMFVDGKATPPMGGFQQHAKERYDALRKLLEEAVEKDAEALVQLKVTRAGDAVEIHAGVADVKKAGGNVRLRLVLVEDIVRYVGSNGQRLHHHVVRSLPGSVEGVAVKDSKATLRALVNLANLRQSLNEYLDEAGQRRPFRDDARPMDFRDLKVIALVQDDDSKEILQAIQMAVPSTN